MCLCLFFLISWPQLRVSFSIPPSILPPLPCFALPTSCHVHFFFPVTIKRSFDAVLSCHVHFHAGFLKYFDFIYFKLLSPHLHLPFIPLFVLTWLLHIIFTGWMDYILIAENKYTPLVLQIHSLSLRYASLYPMCLYLPSFILHTLLSNFLCHYLPLYISSLHFCPSFLEHCLQFFFYPNSSFLSHTDV